MPDNVYGYTKERSFGSGSGHQNSAKIQWWSSTVWLTQRASIGVMGGFAGTHPHLTPLPQQEGGSGPLLMLVVTCVTIGGVCLRVALL